MSDQELGDEDFDALLNSDDEGDMETEDNVKAEDSSDEDEIAEDEFAKELEALNRIRNKSKPPVMYKGNDLTLIAKEMRVKMPGGKDLSWEEALTIETKEPLVLEDVQDDLVREKKFYDSTLEAALRGVELLNKHKIAFRRPTDYFAEMVKTDEDMKKIKQNLLDTKKNIEEAEDRRKKRDMKKFGKKLEAQKRLQKQEDKKKEKKKEPSQVSLPLNDTDDGFNVRADAGEEDSKKRKRSGGDDKESKKPKRSAAADAKAAAKEKKYRTPGKRSGDKRNTKESASSEKNGFNVRRNKSLSTDMKQKYNMKEAGKYNKKKKGPAKRPNKGKRQQKK